MRRNIHLRTHGLTTTYDSYFDKALNSRLMFSGHLSPQSVPSRGGGTIKQSEPGSQRICPKVQISFKRHKMLEINEDIAPDKPLWYFDSQPLIEYHRAFPTRIFKRFYYDGYGHYDMPQWFPVSLALLFAAAPLAPLAFQPPHAANRHDARCRGAGYNRVDVASELAHPRLTMDRSPRREQGPFAPAPRKIAFDQLPLPDPCPPNPHPSK